MAKLPHFELVSFDICPYVQRSVITLLHKKIEHKITFIDLDQTPEWFDQMSPLGKVPLLLVRDTPQSEPTVLFESAIINEYIDEISPPRLVSEDPLTRARERAWVEVSSELLGALYGVQIAQTAAERDEAFGEVWDLFPAIERGVSGGKFFSTQGFSLVDTAFAPGFVRMLLLPGVDQSPEWKKFPKTHAWAKSLIEMSEVKNSMIPNFSERYFGYLKSRGSIWAK